MADVGEISVYALDMPLMPQPPAIARPRVLIIGAGSDIGMAIATKFHARGARVMLCGRNVEGLSAAAAQLKGVRTIACDITAPGQVARMLCKVEEQLGGIDILVCNAGKTFRRDFADQASLADIHDEISVNLTAPIKLIDLAMPLLRRSRATVVFVTSGHVDAPNRHAPVYAAAKAGLRAFIRSVRGQMGALGIRMVEVVPPVVSAPFSTDRALMLAAANWVAVATVRAIDLKRDEARIDASRHFLGSVARKAFASGATVTSH